MRSFSKLMSAQLATTTLLLGSLTLASTAQAAVEVTSEPALYSDKICALHNSFGKDTLVRTSVSIDDLESLQKTVKANATELESQKRTLSEQARQIEELKRNNGSSSSSNNSEISSLKREISDQERAMDQLKRTVEDLSRKVK